LDIQNAPINYISKSDSEKIGIKFSIWNNTLRIDIRTYIINSKEIEAIPTQKGLSLPISFINELQDCIQSLVLNENSIDDFPFMQLSKNSKIIVGANKFRGRNYFYIREFVKKRESTGYEWIPTKKGISLDYSLRDEFIQLFNQYYQLYADTEKNIRIKSFPGNNRFKNFNPIKKLNLSLRVHDILKRNGIDYIEQIHEDLSTYNNLRGFGNNSIVELREKISQYNINHKTTNQPEQKIGKEKLVTEKILEKESYQISQTPIKESSNNLKNDDFLINKPNQFKYKLFDDLDIITKYSQKKNIPIESINLSIRVYHSLKKNKINYLSQLPNAVGNYRLLKNFGEKSLEEIFEKIELYKISLLNSIITKKATIPRKGLLVNGLEISEEEYSVPIESLTLTIRVHNALKRAGIETIYELIEVLHKNIYIRNFGKNAILEVEEKIKLFSPEKQRSKNLSVTNSKDKNNEKSQLVVKDFPIEELELSIRVHNSLKRVDINYVSQLINNPFNHNSIIGLGPKGVNEIEGKLAAFEKQVDFKDFYKNNNLKNQDLNDHLKNEKTNSIIKFNDYKKEIEQKLKSGQLQSNAIFFDKNITEMIKINPEKYSPLDLDFIVERFSKYIIAGDILSNIENMLKDVNDHHRMVLFLRYKFNNLTLQNAGNELNVTRERIRQIESQVKQKVKGNLLRSNQLSKSIYIQSLLIYLSSVGERLSLNKEVSNIIQYFDLSQNYKLEINSVQILFKDWLFAIINFLLSSEDYYFENFNLALKHPDKMISSVVLSENIPKDIFRKARRDSINGGAFYLPAVSQELNKGIDETKEAFEILGFKEIGINWMTKLPSIYSECNGKNFPLVANVLKILKLCGEADTGEIKNGVQQIARRVDVALAPVEILKTYLSKAGFLIQDDLVSCPEKIDIELTGRNKIFSELILKSGPILTYQEICDEFVNCGYSAASAIAMLQFSPLPKRISQALYTFRGNNITREEFLEAEEKRVRISANPEINYTQNGKLVYTLNIGSWGLRGVILLNGVESLSGEWKCKIPGNKRFFKGKMNENYIYGLSKPLEIIGAELGSRIEMEFDVENRLMTLSKAVENRE
jgi:DNA-directed RNA polymerase alpha subunit